MVLSIFFMMVVTFMAYAYLALVPSELRSANRFLLDNEASLAADAGIQDTMALLRQELDANREPFPAMTAAAPWVVRTGTLGDWNWRVRVDCDPQTYPRGTATSGRVYKLTAFARFQGTDVRRVETWVQTGESLAKWAWLLDASAPNLGSFPGRFEGPVHVNGSLNMTHVGNLYSLGGLPMFQNGATVSGLLSTHDGVGYSDVPWDGGGNPIPARYERIYQGGRAGLNSGAAKVEFPTDSAPQARAAWTTGAFPSTNGIHVYEDPASPGSVGAGIFIRGPVNEMVLSVSGGNSVLTVTQAAGVSTVVEVTDSTYTSPGGLAVGVGNTLVIAPDGTETVLSGIPNGMVYSTGTISSLYGTNRGKRTIAVDMSTGQNIRLTHNLLRADTTPGDAPTGTRDSLGLVAQNVRIADFPVAERSNMMFYAAVMAGARGTGGGLVIDNIGVSPGVIFQIFGSHVEASSHGKGFMNAGASNWATAVNTGYWPRVVYDPQLASDPPPFYPTAGGKCQVRSWKETALVN